MPELPEVQTVVDSLAPKLLGRRIVGVRLHRPDVISPAGVNLFKELTGRRVVALSRRGKRIVFTLDNGCRFYVHLGMTGQLTIGPPAPAAEPLPPHTHLELDVESPAGANAPASARLRFRDPRRFGGVWWLGREGSPDRGMGPEPLSQRPAQLGRRLAGTRRAVKAALLDQSLVAGLGNIYVDESLFRAGIHPLTPADALTAAQVARLSRAIKFTLRQAIRHRGSTLRDYMDADGNGGGFQNRHKVYDRFGQPCRACKSPIDRIVLGGRSTHFCPKCQAK